MSANIPEDYALVTVDIVNTQTGHTCEMTWGCFLSPGGPEVSDAHDTVTAAMANITQDMNVDYLYIRNKFTFNVGGTLTTQAFPLAAPQQGTTTGDAATPQVTYLIHKTTLAPGRHGHGRMYVPGVTESKVDNTGLVDPTFLEDAGNHLISFLDILLAGGGDPEVEPLPMYLFGTGPDNPAAVTSLTFESYAATQRRRFKRVS